MSGNMSEIHRTEAQYQDNASPAVSPGGNCSEAFLNELSRRFRADFMVRWAENARRCAGKDPAFLRRLFRRWAIPTQRGGMDGRPDLSVDGRAVE